MGEQAIVPAPSFSILLCVYNGERFLPQTLSSIFNQTCSDFELIAVDDCSSDRSLSILEASRDPRLRIVRQQRRGAAAALAAGFAEAQGEYIALIDHDDLWAREKLALHLDIHRQHRNVDLTFSWFRLINESGTPIGLSSNRYHGTIDFEGLLADFVIGASSNVVIRRKALLCAGGVDAALPRLYDLELCLRVALLKPGNVLAIPHDLMLYRRHPAQITRDLGPLEAEWRQAMRKLERRAPEVFRRIAPQSQANMQRYFAYLAYEQGDYRQAIVRLRRALTSAPTHAILDRRNWRTLAASTSGMILPRSIQRSLERLAGLTRD